MTPASPTPTVASSYLTPEPACIWRLDGPTSWTSPTLSSAHPDHRAHDPLAGRERFYRRDLDPRRWLRVVVDFNDEPAWVVTALVQENQPRGWKP